MPSLPSGRTVLLGPRCHREIPGARWVANRRSILRERSTALTDIVERTRPITLAREQRLPVPEAFESLVPGGLRRAP